jgi:hypothetical protein
MRASLLLAMTVLQAGCVHVSHFHPARAEQAVQGEPASAFTESAGVKAWVRAGDWRGWPEDLEDRMTPVEVSLDNQGAQALDVKPSHFGLLAPNGFRYQALEPEQVQRLVASSWPVRTSVYFHHGYYGAYPWPGFPVRYGHFYPYTWWGWYPVPVLVSPPAPPPGPPPAPQGTLERGGQVSLLLLFPVPAASLPGFELTADLVTPGGERLGTLQVALVRAD